ncbi:MAG: thioesterase family protein [Pseudomonadota bacterium]
MSFTEDTRVDKHGDRFIAEIRAGWDIVGNANGGYLMAIGARAMAAVGKPQPVALTAHFLAPGRPGPLTVTPAVAKRGRRFDTIRATVAGAERPLVELLGSFGEPSAADEAVRVDAEPPALPPADDCVRVRRSPSGFPPPIMDRVDLRLHPDDAAFMAGKPSGRPEFRGWFRLAGDEAIDAFALLLAADIFPPTVFNANLPVAWTPTLELTAHLRCTPAPGWLRCRFSTRFITGGMLEEDGEVWDERGRLVAQSRQLALLPRP